MPWGGIDAPDSAGGILAYWDRINAGKVDADAI
jgi:hypothetical protein